RQPCLRLRHGEYSRVHHHLSSRQTKRIRLGIVHDAHLPFHRPARVARAGAEPPHHSLNHVDLRPFGNHPRSRQDFLVTLQAQRCLLSLRHCHPCSPSRLRIHVLLRTAILEKHDHTRDEQRPQNKLLSPGTWSLIRILPLVHRRKLAASARLTPGVSTAYSL